MPDLYVPVCVMKNCEQMNGPALREGDGQVGTLQPKIGLQNYP